MAEKNDSKLELDIAGFSAILKVFSDWLCIPVEPIKTRLQLKADLSKQSKSAIENLATYKILSGSKEVPAEARKELLLKEFGPEIAALYEREARKVENVRLFAQKVGPELDACELPTEQNIELLTYMLEGISGVTDDEVRELWAHIFVREAEAPRTFSRRSITRLLTFDRADIEILQKMAARLVIGGQRGCLLLPTRNSSYSDQDLKNIGLKYDDLLDMVDAGLLLSLTTAALTNTSDPPEPLTLTKMDSSSLRLVPIVPNLQCLIATNVGLELCKLVETSLDEKYVNALVAASIVKSETLVVEAQ
jgi:hypothetical protein